MGTGFPEKKRTRKKLLAVAIAVAAGAGILAAGLSIYGNYQMSKIPGLSFQEALAYTTKGRSDAVITVGILQAGIASYTVYGEDGQVLPSALHTYEIGSLTKTFTAALVSRAVQERRLDLDTTIDTYLSLPAGNIYPTVQALLTHTSGYQGYYLEGPMVSKFFTGRNSFYGITGKMVLDKAGKLNLPKENYPFDYSNYGYAVLGLVLEAVYGCNYTTLVAQFTQDLGLTQTQISTQDGDLGQYWSWKDADAYLPAGGLTSDIHDMLTYAQLQLDGAAPFASTHLSQKEINAATQQYQKMGIHMDEIGMAWIIDRENGVIWHNGGTGNYNCYLGFCPETDTAVVVLSNLSPNEKIPATVLGIKLLQELNR